MSIIELTGWVPVTVTVDTDLEEVTSVNVWDEDFHYDRHDPKNDPRKKAFHIAEDADWGGWEFGG